jgi:hypothetical protein
MTPFQDIHGNQDLACFRFIMSICAYNSIYIIEKTTTDFRPLCGETVIFGDDSTVEPRVFRTSEA